MYKKHGCAAIAWTCKRDKQHGQAAWMCIIFLNVHFNFYVNVPFMFMQHVHTAWTCSKDMQPEDIDLRHGNAVWTCCMEKWTWRMEMRHGIQYWHAEWTGKMYVHDVQAARTSSMYMQHGHETWICSIGMHNGHA
jgi:hypothetical protein